MAAIYTVNDGDDAVAADLNQLVNALNNVLGITDTAQVALGRLVLPVSLLVAVPGSPVVGQMYMTTDEGASGGRIYTKHTTDIVPYLPTRQVIRSANLGATTDISSTSLVDLGLSISIVTTGGKLRIYLVPNNTGGTESCFVFKSTSGNRDGHIQAVVGAQNLGAISVGDEANPSPGDGVSVNPGGLIWDYQPAPGSYTVKIRAKVTVSGAIMRWSSGWCMVVEEWGD